ncbi:hypothetical protein DAI22_01g485000 [Oryza sativa Japonica Group]|jgi:magnesium-transporting ATPase (P-type)|nr:hypothetical protein DAI22_01g485000 [Oryza sativa Japonica Group]
MTAIEEMAGMDVLCCDKIGTLTLNHLTVDKNLIEVSGGRRHVPGAQVRDREDHSTGGPPVRDDRQRHERAGAEEGRHRHSQHRTR